MSDKVIKGIVKSFEQYRKANSTDGLGPWRRYIGPNPTAPTVDGNGYVQPAEGPEKLAAVAQVEQIATLAEPLIQNYAGEKQLIAALQKLVNELTKLVNGIEKQQLAKAASAAPPPGFRKTFIGYAEPVKPTRVIAANSLDAIVAR